MSDDGNPVVKWSGWRRKGRHGAWEHFKVADAPTKGQCYQDLMNYSELSAHEGQYEYLILEAGQRPPADLPSGR